MILQYLKDTNFISGNADSSGFATTAYHLYRGRLWTVQLLLVDSLHRWKSEAMISTNWRCEAHARQGPIWSAADS